MDGIYLYGAAEDGTSSADVFYDVGGHLYRTNQLNDAPAAQSGPPFDLSDSRGSALLNFLLDDLDRLLELHKGHEREPPTQLKAHFDAVTRKLSVAWLQEMKDACSRDT